MSAAAPIVGDAHAILESMGDAFYALDADWRIVYANRHALAFWDATADDVVGRVIWQRFPELVGTLNETALRQAHGEQCVVSFEASSPTTGVPVSVTVRPSGAGVAVYWRDIADRVRSEQALRRSEEHLRLAQEAGGIGTWEWDLHTGRMIWSAQMFRVLGREPEAHDDLMPVLLHAVHPEDRAAVALSLAEFRGRAGPLRMEVRVVWPDGTVRWIVFLGRSIADAAGTPVRMLGIAIDGTSRRRGEDSIREDAERLRLAMEAGGLATWEFDIGTQIRHWSPQAALMHGFPAGKTAISREEWGRMVHPDDLPRLRVEFAKVLRGEGDYSLEYRIVRPDGETRWTAVHGTLLRDTDGPGRVIGVLQDITARKRIEEMLRESEARLAMATQAAGIGIWDWNLLDDSMRYSEQAKAICGFPPDEQVNYAMVRDVTHPDDYPWTSAQARRALDPAIRDAADYEYRLRLPDGRIRWVSASGQAIFAEVDGVLRGVRYVGTIQDITDRKRAEQALIDSESRLRDNDERLRELLNTIHLAAVFVRGLDGRIRFWSRGCERLYGWTADEAVGRSAHELLDTIFPEPLADIEATLRQAGEWQGDVRHRRKDGSVLTVSMRKVLRAESDGRPAAILESVADVTSLRQMEAELRALNQELEARVRAEVAARESAQTRAAHAERMQALGQLAGGIAHDFNNVLQSIQGGAALMRRRASDPDAVKRFSEMILDAAGRGASITRRLLAFARRGDLRAEAISPAELLHGMREVLAPALGAGIDIRVEAPDDLPALLADKGQLETALVNLAVNARDAMRSGGILILSAAAESVGETEARHHPAGLVTGRYIRITVADAGEGMDAATLTRVLEPFFTTKPPGQGTGLGLPMVKGFAEQSGGGLRIESERGRGTTVVLWLPQANRVAIPDAASDVRDAGGRGAAARLLLVDDDALVRESLAAQLEELSCDVLLADSSDEALALIAAGERVDALVTDLSMPGMDGLALIRAAQAQRPGLPAVLLTGYAGDGTALAMSGVISGSYTLLRKPVSAEQLADRVAALLEA